MKFCVLLSLIRMLIAVSAPLQVRHPHAHIMAAAIIMAPIMMAPIFAKRPTRLDAKIKC